MGGPATDWRFLAAEMVERSGRRFGRPSRGRRRGSEAPGLDAHIRICLDQGITSYRDIADQYAEDHPDLFPFSAGVASPEMTRLHSTIRKRLPDLKRQT